VDFGELEGRRWKDISTGMQKALLEFDGFEAPCGETTVVFRQRVMAFLNGLPEGDHLLFTHGGVIRVLAHAAGRVPSMAPAAIVRFRLSGQTDRPLVLLGSVTDARPTTAIK
jgi:probable phosphoglycerate mutase